MLKKILLAKIETKTIMKILSLIKIKLDSKNLILVFLCFGKQISDASYYHPSEFDPPWKLSKLDEPDMQNTAGEAETSS